jgi:ribose-phosphate pyrophosphokinase
MAATRFRELQGLLGQRARRLTKEIAEFLGVQSDSPGFGAFPDTEVSFQIDENIRGTDVFVVQPTCATDGRSIST